MNTRRTQRETPRITNFASGRGHGYNPVLGRPTFIYELIARVDSSTGYLNRISSSVRIIHVPPRLESSVSTMDKSVGATAPPGSPAKCTPKDRGNYVGVGGPKEVYQINGQEVTKEEWLWFRQEFKDHKKQEE